MSRRHSSETKRFHSNVSGGHPQPQPQPPPHHYASGHNAAPPPYYGRGGPPPHAAVHYAPHSHLSSTTAPAPPMLSMRPHSSHPHQPLPYSHAHHPSMMNSGPLPPSHMYTGIPHSMPLMNVSTQPQPPLPLPLPLPLSSSTTGAPLLPPLPTTATHVMSAVHPNPTSMDPRRMQRIPTQSLPRITQDNNEEGCVLHFAKGDKFGAFAVVMRSIYGPKMLIDTFPFGTSDKDAQPFDGRIPIKPVVQYLVQAVNSPKKQVHVFECSPLSATDQSAFRDFVKLYSRTDRCAVIDSEYEYGVLLYLVPSKLATTVVDFSKQKAKHLKKRTHKSKRQKMADAISAKYEETHLAEEFKYLPNTPFTLQSYLHISKTPKDSLWIVSITSASRSLVHRVKQRNQKNGSNVHSITNTKAKTTANTVYTNKLEQFGPLVSDDSDNEERDWNNSELLTALTQFYQKTGVPLP